MVPEIRCNDLRSRTSKRPSETIHSPDKRPRNEKSVIICSLKDIITCKKKDPKSRRHSSAKSIQTEELSANNLAREHEKKIKTELAICRRDNKQNLFKKPEAIDKVCNDTNKECNETKTDDILKTLQHDQENTTYSLASKQNFHWQDSLTENCWEERVFTQPLSMEDLSIENEIVNDTSLNFSWDSCHGNDDIEIKSIHYNGHITNYDQSKNNYQIKYSSNTDNSGFTVLGQENNNTKQPLFRDCVYLRNTINDTNVFDNCSSVNSYLKEPVESVSFAKPNDIENKGCISLNDKVEDEIYPSKNMAVGKLNSGKVATKQMKSTKKLKCKDTSKNAINSVEETVDHFNPNVREVHDTRHLLNGNCVNLQHKTEEFNNCYFANNCLEETAKSISLAEFNANENETYVSLNNKIKNEACPSGILNVNILNSINVATMNLKSTEKRTSTKKSTVKNAKEFKTTHGKANPINSFVPTNVKECTKSWKLKYPWVELNEETGDLFCFSCTLVLSYECVVCAIKTSEDIFLVASNLLRHSVSDMHNLTPFIWQPRIFAEVYSLLKFNLWYFTSKEMLFERVNSILRTSLGLEVSESVIKSLISAIASIVNELAILTVQKKQDSGVGFILDPCRRLLIARYSNNQNHPEEHLITDFMKSSLTLSEYFKKNNLSTWKITFLNQRVVCKNCSQSKDVKKRTDENSLPPRYPRVMELLRWLEEDPYFKTYSIFIRNLKYLCVKYPSNFNLIRGIEILSEARWEDFRVYIFIEQNFYLLKDVSELIYKITQDHWAKKCIDFELNQNGNFGESLALISSIYSHFHNETAEAARKSFRVLINKVDFYCTKMLKNGKDFPHPKTLKYIKLYCEELTKEGYLYGRRNISHFDVFFRPQALSSLEKLDGTLGEKLVHPSRKVFFTATRYLHVTEEQLSLSLKSFGAFLYRTFSLSHVSLCKMLELFNVYPEIKERFPLAFRFYIMISTVPFFTALVEKSLFNMWMLKTHFTEYFGKELAIDLLSISLEGPIPQMGSQLYSALLKRIINSKRKE